MRHVKVVFVSGLQVMAWLPTDIVYGHRPSEEEPEIKFVILPAHHELNESDPAAWMPDLVWVKSTNVDNDHEERPYFRVHDNNTMKTYTMRNYSALKKEYIWANDSLLEIFVEDTAYSHGDLNTVRSQLREYYVTETQPEMWVQMNDERHQTEGSLAVAYVSTSKAVNAPVEYENAEYTVIGTPGAYGTPYVGMETDV